MTGIFGRISGRLFATYDRGSRSWRTSPTTEGSDSIEFSGTVPKTGSMSGGHLYELPTQGHPITENVCSLLLPTPKASLRGDCPSERSRRSPDLVSVKYHFPEDGSGPDYEPAITHWESLTREAPGPKEPNKNGNQRLAVRFNEWMMGLPEGWVSDSDLPYGSSHKMLGNGVVPQQAELALRKLLAT